MRLIDADALKKKVQVLSCDDMGGETWHVVEEKDIDEAPTIDRPHGEWIKDWEHEEHGDASTICSLCRYSPFRKSNFCPNCGADMRKEGDEK